MRHLLLTIMLLYSAGEVWAASNDMLLNLKDPASSNPLFPTLRVEGKMDDATNPTVKVPMLPCLATAAAPSWTEGHIVPCSVDLAGGIRGAGSGGIATANDDGSCPNGAASFTVAASNASRTWLALWASPANTDDVYVKLGTTATNTDARIAPGQPINFVTGRIYTGRIDALPASGTQAVCVMELN